MITETTWSPDTCGCKLVYSIDTDNSSVTTFVRAERICKEHEGLVDHSKIFDNALADNRRKNLTYKKIIESHPELTDTTPDGGIIAKPHVEFNWQYTGKDDSRILSVSLKSKTDRTELLTKKQKDNIANELDSNTVFE